MACNLYRSGMNLPLICLLVIRLRTLGQCAVLRREGTLKSTGGLSTNTQGRLLVGRGSDETLKLKVQYGKLLIGLDGAYKDYGDALEVIHSDSGSHESGYQSDQAGMHELQRLQERVYGSGLPNSVVQQLLGMKPKVECVEDSMMLKVSQGTAGFDHGLFIDRGSVPPLPLSKVPSGCGLHVQRVWPDVAFFVPYDACYVIQERNAYVLPLRLWGLPAKMSCPFLNLAPSRPLASCYANGMVLKTQNIALIEDLLVKVDDQWLPILRATSICDYSVMFTSEGLMISAPFEPCMKVKDGVYSLHIAAEKEYRFLCPALMASVPLNLSSQIDQDPSGRVASSPSAPVKERPTEPRSTPRSPVKLLWLDYATQSVPKPSFTTQSSVPTPPATILPKGQMPSSSNGWYAHDAPTPIVPTPTTRSSVPTSAPSTSPQKAQRPHYPMTSGSWYPVYPKPQGSIVPSPVTPHSTTLPWLDSPTAGAPTHTKQSSISSVPQKAQHPHYPKTSGSWYPVYPKPQGPIVPSPVTPHSTTLPWLDSPTAGVPIHTKQSSISSVSQKAQRPHYPKTSGSWYPVYPKLQGPIVPSPVTPHSTTLPWLDGPTAAVPISTKPSSTSSTPLPQKANQMPYPITSGNWHPVLHPNLQITDPSPISGHSTMQSPVQPTTSEPNPTTQISRSSALSTAPQKAHQLPYYPMVSGSWYPLYPPKHQITTHGLADTHESFGKASTSTVDPERPECGMPVGYSPPSRSVPFKDPHQLSVAPVYSPTDIPTLEPSVWLPPGSLPPQHPRKVGPDGPVFAENPYKHYLHQYSQRPVTFPLVPNKMLETSWTPYQTVAQTLKPLNYLQCCPSTPMNPNCCQSVLYHQHSHNHFSFPYPAFDPNSGLGPTRNLTSSFHTTAHSGSSFQPVFVHTESNYEQASSSLTLQDDLKDVVQPSESLSSLYPIMFPKFTTGAQMTVNHLFPSREGQWGVDGHLYKSWQHAPNGQPFVHVGNRPKSRPYTSSNVADYQPLPNGVLPFERHPSLLPISGKNNPKPLMFPHDGSSQSYPVDTFSAHLYAENPLSVLRGNIPQVEVLPSFDSIPKSPKQDVEFERLKQNPVSEPLMVPNIQPQNQAFRFNEPSRARLPGPPSEDFPRLPFKADAGQFSKRWVPVTSS